MKNLLRSLALLGTILFWSCSDSDQIRPPGETSVYGDDGIIRMVEDFRNRVSEYSRFSKSPLIIEKIEKEAFALVDGKPIPVEYSRSECNDFEIATVSFNDGGNDGSLMDKEAMHGF